ncbi:WD40 repeat-like protein [Rozella allomycis CSF55]|uniref:WD40 repeat-like protein n=1 Tax=Rozella allomycis (strain CSF55) TaxID=988480 RepID=A0A075B2H5_ROZAC|nr:hypothetical protein O9G_003199 [Rozella allomycis CSF55]RKP18885.1 WD40 repeat-like protein [Rozella allomycis CSF55]|eukprot:EPZ35013.1 hypothetical protein O9G_003199 [Rozella allomycis CSF55]
MLKPAITNTFSLYLRFYFVIVLEIGMSVERIFSLSIPPPPANPPKRRLQSGPAKVSLTFVNHLRSRIGNSNPAQVNLDRVEEAENVKQCLLIKELCLNGIEYHGGMRNFFAKIYIMWDENKQMEKNVEPIVMKDAMVGLDEKLEISWIDCEKLKADISSLINNATLFIEIFNGLLGSEYCAPLCWAFCKLKEKTIEKNVKLKAFKLYTKRNKLKIDEIMSVPFMAIKENERVALKDCFLNLKLEKTELIEEKLEEGINERENIEIVEDIMKKDIEIKRRNPGEIVSIPKRSKEERLIEQKAKSCKGLKFSSYGEFCVSCFNNENDGFLALIKEREEILKVFERIFNFDISFNDQIIAACCENGQIYFWNSETGYLIEKIEIKDSCFILFIYENFENYILIGTKNGEILYYLINFDGIKISLGFVCTLKANSKPIKHLIFNKDSKNFCSADEGGIIKEWIRTSNGWDCIKTYNELSQRFTSKIQIPIKNFPRDCTVSRKLISKFNSKSILSPCGTFLISPSIDNNLYYISTENNQIVHSHDFDGEISALDFHPLEDKLYVIFKNSNKFKLVKFESDERNALKETSPVKESKKYSILDNLEIRESLEKRTSLLEVLKLIKNANDRISTSRVASRATSRASSPTKLTSFNANALLNKRFHSMSNIQREKISTVVQRFKSHSHLSSNHLSRQINENLRIEHNASEATSNKNKESKDVPSNLGVPKPYIRKSIYDLRAEPSVQRQKAASTTTLGKEKYLSLMPKETIENSIREHNRLKSEIMLHMKPNLSSQHRSYSERLK